MEKTEEVSRMTDGRRSREGISENLAGVCRTCGTPSVKLYQYNTCKNCLLLSFGKYVGMINGVRHDAARVRVEINA